MDPRDVIDKDTTVSSLKKRVKERAYVIASEAPPVVSSKLQIRRGTYKGRPYIAERGLGIRGERWLQTQTPKETKFRERGQKAYVSEPSRKRSFTGKGFGEDLLTNAHDLVREGQKVVITRKKPKKRISV